MTDIFYDADADLGRLHGRTVAMIGYGIQGPAQALNMRVSGIENLVVGSIHDESWEQAEADGFSPVPIRDAVEGADIGFMLVPDEVAPAVYEEHVGPALGPGKTLNFASGYNIAFDHIQPPEEVDVTMVAPRMFGEGLRNLFVAGGGAPCLLLVSGGIGFLFYVLGGLLGKRWGRREVLIGTGLLVAPLNLLFLFVDQFALVVIVYFLIYQVTNGTWSGAGYAYQAEGFPTRMRGTAVGFLGAIVAGGFLIGAALWTLLISATPRP